MSKLPPVIDLQGEETKIVEEIKRACEMHGFFVVTNHSVDNDLVNTTRNEAKKFFGLSEEEKLKLRLDPKRKHLRGYVPLGAEASDVFIFFLNSFVKIILLLIQI